MAAWSFVPGNTAINISSDVELVFFDLETTGLARTSHITQIAAVRVGPGQTDMFGCYVKPGIDISAEAQIITKITYDARIDQMFKGGIPVSSVGIKTALSLFLQYLGSRAPAKVVLLAHNARNFDAPVLMNAALNCRMETSLNNTVLGFVDTLPVFKEKHPGLESYNLAKLCEHFHLAMNLHDATEDVKALQAVMAQPSATITSELLYFQALSRHSFTVRNVLDNL